jgi:hypothetical protein
MPKLTPEKKAAVSDLLKRKHHVAHSVAKQMVDDFAALKADMGAIKENAPFFDDYNPLFPKSIAVNKASLLAILQHPNCIGLRFYPALNQSKKFTLVIVGIDKKGDNLTPLPAVETPAAGPVANGAAAKKSARTAKANAQNDGVLDEGQHDPPFTPPANDF